jgi:hypothetical protein
MSNLPEFEAKKCLSCTARQGKLKLLTAFKPDGLQTANSKKRRCEKKNDV